MLLQLGGCAVSRTETIVLVPEPGSRVRLTGGESARRQFEGWVVQARPDTLVLSESLGGTGVGHSVPGLLRMELATGTAPRRGALAGATIGTFAGMAAGLLCHEVCPGDPTLSAAVVGALGGALGGAYWGYTRPPRRWQPFRLPGP